MASLREQALLRARGGKSAIEEEDAEAARDLRRSGGAEKPLAALDSTLVTKVLERVLPPDALKVAGPDSPPPAPTPFYSPMIAPQSPATAPQGYQACARNSARAGASGEDEGNQRDEEQRLKAILSTRAARPVLGKEKLKAVGVRTRDMPLRADELEHAALSSDSDDLGLAKAKRNSRATRVPDAVARDSSSSSYDSDHMQSASRRGQSSSHKGRHALSSLKERADAARRGSFHRQHSKSKSVLRLDGLREIWEEDRRMQRDEL